MLWFAAFALVVLPRLSADVGAGGARPADTVARNPDTLGNGSATLLFTSEPFGIPAATSSLIEWNNPAGGSFHTAINWEPQVVPGASDTATFDLAAIYSVDVGTATTDRLEIRNGDVTFTDADYSVAASDLLPAGTLIDDAVLTLASGTLSGIHALIGESAAARLNVGTGATVNDTSKLQVGGAGNGILSIDDGGLVFCSEGRIGTGVGGGTAMLDGPGALWQSGSLFVGYNGMGDLFISGGATVLCDLSDVGWLSGAGVVEVEGDESNWDISGFLALGVGGTGELNVLAGGRVSCGFLDLGNGREGSALIEGFGAQPSLLDVANDVSVGLRNVGTLEIRAGAIVRTATGSVTLGYYSTFGSIVVSGKSTMGPSLLEANSSIVLGIDEGSGSLFIEEDATAVCENAEVGSFTDGEGIAVTRGR